MDAQRFDRLATSLATATSRRGVLAVLLGSLLHLLGLRPVPAGRKQKRRRHQQQTRRRRRRTHDARANSCTKDKDCCTGNCDRSKGRCRCKKLGEGCSEDRNCCASFGQPMTCQSGTCQRVQPPTPPPPGCTPTTCAAQGATCGPLPDGCGSTLECGPCPCAPACLDCQRCNPTTAQCEPESGICCPGGRCEAGVCQACGVCEACSGGGCGPAVVGTACAGGFCCGTPPSCVDVQTDPSHCGACGVPCAEGQSCQGGVCGVACGGSFCPAASEVCDGSNCRGCTVTCDAPNHICDGTGLQSALMAAAASGGAVVVCAGRYIGNFTMSPQQAVTVIGAGQGDDPGSATILDAVQQGPGPVLRIDFGNGNVALERLRITGGSTGFGAGIYHHGGRLQMRDCTVTGNTATSSGGGIYVDFSPLEMTRCTVSDNRSGSDQSFVPGGGGITVDFADQATLTDCLIADNSAFFHGGGILFLGNPNAPFTLAGSTEVRGNTTVRGGGGISHQSGQLAIGAACRVTRNTAPAGSGGGIQNFGNTVTLAGPDPSPIIVDNCRENCAGQPVPGCALGGPVERTCPPWPA